MENYKLAQSVSRFKEIADELSNLYKDKNTNYGNSFGELYEDLGPISGLVPLHNKLNRLKHLITTENKDNKFESIEDTIKDLASYAIMNLIEFEKYRDKQDIKTIKLTDNKISFWSIAKMVVWSPFLNTPLIPRPKSILPLTSSKIKCSVVNSWYLR